MFYVLILLVAYSLFLNRRITTCYQSLCIACNIALHNCWFLSTHLSRNVINLQSLSVFASPKIQHFLCFFPIVKFVTLLLCLFVVLVSIVDKFYILTKKGKMFLNICGIYEYLFLNS